MFEQMAADRGRGETRQRASSATRRSAPRAGSHRCSNTSPPKRRSSTPRRCVQIHGGNGYMTEYGAEKLLRDAMVMPIYEGTEPDPGVDGDEGRADRGSSRTPRTSWSASSPSRAGARLSAARSARAAGGSTGRPVAEHRVLQRRLVTKTATRQVPLPDGQRAACPSGRIAFLKNWDPKKRLRVCHAPRRGGSPGCSPTSRSARRSSSRRKAPPRAPRSPGPLPRASRAALAGSLARRDRLHAARAGCSCSERSAR